jgi:TRAP-type uncharacterized transport system substrate-binding protein
MKKIQIAKDLKGAIVGFTELASGEGVSAEVVLEEGETLEEIEVTNDYVFNQPKRIQAVRDSKGAVVATTEFPSGETIRAEAVLEKDEILEEMDLSSDYILELDSLYAGRFKV